MTADETAYSATLTPDQQQAYAALPSSQQAEMAQFYDNPLLAYSPQAATALPDLQETDSTETDQVTGPGETTGPVPPITDAAVPESSTTYWYTWYLHTDCILWACSHATLRSWYESVNSRVTKADNCTWGITGWKDVTIDSNAEYKDVQNGNDVCDATVNLSELPYLIYGEVLTQNMTLNGRGQFLSRSFHVQDN